MKLAVLLFLCSLLRDCGALPKPVDCNDILERIGKYSSLQSRVYTIYPYGEKFGVEAYCDMTTAGGGWTVIQRRMDGSVNFYRPWSHYKTGFGDADGEHWLGLEFIHMLSSRKPHELLVEMEDFEGKNASARYTSFSVGSECDGYTLQVSGFIDGGADLTCNFAWWCRIFVFIEMYGFNAKLWNVLMKMSTRWTLHQNIYTLCL